MIFQGRSFSGLERNCSFLNTGSSSEAAGRFATISSTTGLDFPDDGRALAVTDWDNDGDLDVWLSARTAPRLRLMQNTTKSGGHWLTLRLQGNGSATNRDAIGARVELLTSDEKKEKSIQTLRAGEGFLSQHSKQIHFGLGAESEPQKVLVSWPGGEKELFLGLRVDGAYLLIQGSGQHLAEPIRNPAALALQAASPKTPEPAPSRRIGLTIPLPLDQFPLRALDEKLTILKTREGNPALLLLWSSTCPDCLQELTELNRRKEEIRNSGLSLLALSVDGLTGKAEEIKRAKTILTDLNFPFPAGYAVPELVEDLQEMHNLVVPFQHTLPVPSAFLIDKKKQITVMYKGRLDIDTLLQDVNRVQSGKPFSLETIAPLSGHSVDDANHARVDRENGARTYFRRGLKLSDEGRLEEATSYYQRALELKPDSYKINFNLGSAYAQLGEVEAAQFHLQQSLFFKPDFFLPYRVLGDMFLRTGQPLKAKEQYQMFLQKNPDNGKSIGKLGIIEVQLGHLDKAQNYFQQAIQLDPGNAELHYNLGITFLLQKEFQKAEDWFLKTISLQPDYPDVFYNIGYMAEKEKDLSRAARFYLTELKNQPEAVKALTGLGRLMETQGNRAGAMKYYQRVLERMPDNIEAKTAIERLSGKTDQ